MLGYNSSDHEGNIFYSNRGIPKFVLWIQLIPPYDISLIPERGIYLAPAMWDPFLL